MYYRINSIIYNLIRSGDGYGKSVHKHLFDLNPSLETAKSVIKYGYNYVDITLGALSSFMGTSPYSRIDHDTFISIVKYAMDISQEIMGERNCSDFFSDCIKHVKTDKARKYLLSVMLSICVKESFMEEFTKKSQILSHIPEGYYQ